jgi:hypothetical protein
MLIALLRVSAEIYTTRRENRANGDTIEGLWPMVHAPFVRHNGAKHTKMLGLDWKPAGRDGDGLKILRDIERSASDGIITIGKPRGRSKSGGWPTIPNGEKNWVVSVPTIDERKYWQTAADLLRATSKISLKDKEAVARHQIVADRICRWRSITSRRSNLVVAVIRITFSFSVFRVTERKERNIRTNGSPL